MQDLTQAKRFLRDCCDKYQPRVDYVSLADYAETILQDAKGDDREIQDRLRYLFDRSVIVAVTSVAVFLLTVHFMHPNLFVKFFLLSASISALYSAVTCCFSCHFGLQHLVYTKAELPRRMIENMEPTYAELTGESVQENDANLASKYIAAQYNLQLESIVENIRFRGQHMVNASRRYAYSLGNLGIAMLLLCLA